MDERYKAYLESDWWKKTRTDYIESIGNKCECCGKPFDLQVHHLTYEHLGFERDYELKCLCRNCHQWIEEQKRCSDKFLDIKAQVELLNARKSYLSNHTHFVTEEQVVQEFIKYCISNDLSNGGNYNFEKIEVLKNEFVSFCNNNNYPLYDANYILRVRDAINPIRYRIILNYMSRGYPKNEIVNRTGFSNSMISKVFKNPETYRKIASFSY